MANLETHMVANSELSDAAILVKMLWLNVESKPRCIQMMFLNKKKQRIEFHMREILTLLELDLSDDSLEETPRRIAKMYVDEVFLGSIIKTSRKLPSLKIKCLAVRWFVSKYHRY